MDNQTVQKLKDLIAAHQNIGVIVGSNPSVDKMAAGLGLYLTLKKMGKEVIVACPTNPIVAVSNLVGIDKVQKTLGTTTEGGDLVVAFPYKEGEIEKVSYTLENGALNIVVKAGEKGLSFSQSDVTFTRSGGSIPTLLFFVGVPHLSDVAALYQPGAQQVTVVNLDNDVQNEKYGDMPIIDMRWSSVSEQIADFVTLLEPQVEIDRDIAQNLLDGITFATNDFRNQNTSYLAFEVAGILMKKGATRTIITAPTTQDASNFFPSIKPQSQSNVAQPLPSVNFQQAFQGQSVAPIQPAPIIHEEPVQQPAPIAQVPVQQPVITSQPTQQTPPDWLTPKVYKGSSIL